VGIDSAGGLVQATAQAFVRLDGALAAVVGATVQGHGLGAHLAATLPTGSTFVRIDGQAVVAAGMAASCGHTATGSPAASVQS
jgi:uncharacterized Zn-binding protein involved in type VI secretion